MKKIYILSMLLVILCMTNCKDPLEDETFTMSDATPVGIYLESQPQFSLWVEMLKKTDLYNTLNINTKYTCFVSDNDGVNQYLKEKGYNSIDDIPLETMTYIMRYHIIPEISLTHSSFSGMITTKTASGDYLSVKYGDGGINSMYVNDIALIVNMDIEVTNGYLHQIDQVLDPIVESVWDLIKSNNNYSIFQEALELCQLDEWLDSKVKYVGENELDDYKTVFIVSDQTFSENGISNIEDLKRRYPTNDYLNDTSAFRKFVSYHIINSFSDFGELATFSDNNNKIKNLLTVAVNEMFTLEDIQGRLVINRQAEPVYLIEDKYDQQANNGYLHEIDHLMPITSPVVMTTVWDFTDFDEFKVMDIYRNGSPNHSTASLNKETSVNIVWETIPERANAVGYYVRTDQTWNTNRDLFEMKLGSVGWVEITFPVLPAGTYQLTIYKFAYSDNRGKLQMYLDGDKFGPALSFTNGGGNSVVLGTKDFPDSRQHVVKFVALKSGPCEVDRIVLQPVN